MNKIGVFLGSFVVCVIVTEILKKALVSSRLSTNKEKPMLLGGSIFLTVVSMSLLGGLFYETATGFIYKLILGAGLILVLGVLDDIKELSPKAKILGQLVPSVLMVFLGVHITIHSFPFFINAIITVFWIVTLINAFNLLDIMDGLCPGISLVISAGFSVVSYVSGNGFTTIFFLILTGSLVCAFLYNKPKAKLYLGDSGSMLLGFVFACGALQISYAPNSKEALSLLVPILLVLLPLYDLTVTIIVRGARGIPVVNKSPDHFVLILKKAGWPKGLIVMLMVGITAFFSFSAVFLKTSNMFMKKIIVFSDIIVVILLIGFFSKVIKKRAFEKNDI